MSVSFPSGNPLEKLRKLRRDIEQGAIDGVTQTVLGAKRQAQQNLTDLDKIDQGILRASIDTEVTVRNGQVIGRVFCTASYGQWVECGRRGIDKDPTGGNAHAATAAWPPVDVIRAWVKRHFNEFAPLGRTKSGRAKRSRVEGKQDKAIARVAFLVGRKIYRYGIKPTPFLIPAFLLWSKKVNQLVNDAILARKAAP